MMSHILDRPIWSALETAHASLSEGNALARRYPPSIVPFAASADNSPESLEALARLPLGEEVMAIVEAEPIIAPEGLVTLSSAVLVQMMAERPSERVSIAGSCR